ncbi:NAD(P)-dependent oxidoreductase [Sneathiella sp. CAU 1612]|uniref:NAD(P)-dependent oxidoreductase n=1 Tax=Sneathiella sedimenti TaxID=2816034 RepID=A0ABS3F7A0_9PROT|nr:NAD(P)-dependent oxidoreductase [Sneathiella sedimenti]MBO0334402.1 NAD(P)-dependent oxidoreductase [Sneathiella sedimenti]
MGEKAAFIGLGVMGYPMAGFLQKAGYETTVYNRTGAKAEKWVAEYGGAHAATPAKAAEGADFVMVCVGNDDDLRSVVLGENGILATMKAGSIFVDHTTASAEVARELAAVAKEKGVGFVDAPVSGGQAGAENGVLTVMCGGAQADFDRASKPIDAYARACMLMGDVGAGQLTKMVNQICIAGVVQGLSEGIHFAEQAGLDAEKVIEVISKGAAQSWQMENRYKTMIANKFDYGFAVDWMRKDLGICLKTGDQIGASLPNTALVDQYYADVQNMGGNRWDTSSLITRLRKLKK